MQKFFFIIVLVFSTQTYAQFLYRQATNLVSPVTTNARYPLLLGTTATVITLTDKNKTSEKYTQQTSKKKALREDSRWGDKYGNGLVIAGYSAGVLTYSLAAWESHHLSNMGLMIEAVGYSALVTWTLKNTVRQRRPNGEDRLSFPSGHAASSMAFATVVHAVHGIGWGMLGYGFAGYVAFTRMHDGAHYLHDVIAGATIGMSYGWGVYLNKVGKYRKKSASAHQFELLPTPDFRGTQMAWNYQF